MTRTVLQCVAVCWLVILAGCAARQAASEGGSIQYVETDTGRWLVHDVNRPAPPVISPGTASTQSEPGKVPSDAIVLFDGTDLSGWTSERGGPTVWIVQNGYMEAVGGSGSIKTKQAFGSCQLHVEFAAPSNITGSDQDRGNSGVYLMSTYEVQILDSYENPDLSRRPMRRAIWQGHSSGKCLPKTGRVAIIRHLIPSSCFRWRKGCQKGNVHRFA